MAVEDRIQESQQPPSVDRLTTADIIERLTRFEGPPEQFLVNLLAVQCYVSGAQAGAILRAGAEGQGVEVLSLFPPLAQDTTAPVWLAQAVELAAQIMPSGRTAVRPVRAPDELYGQPSQQHLIMIPLRGGGGTVRGVAAFYLESYDPTLVDASRERLELTVSLLSLYEMRLTLQRRQLDLRRLRLTLETLAAVNEQDRLAGTSMALCNEVASRWQADRVSLGLLKGRYVKLKGLSHTEKFSRKMKLVQDIEAAMEECLDQDVEIVHPAEAEATFVSRATGELCKRHGPTAIVSLPLRKGGEPMAVLTAERPLDRPFNIEEIEALRLTCDLCTPRVAVLAEHDRWIGAKALAGARKGLAFAVGSKHTWAKVAAIVALGCILFVSLVKGAHQAEAPFTLEAAERQIVPAPFEGFIKSVSQVRPGDPVHRGTELATLQTWELELQLSNALADQDNYQAQADLANRDGETAKKQIADAEVRRIGAQIDLLRKRIEQARIVSPIEGVLLAGDWTQSINKPVKTGEPLFEVAPIGPLWADLSVPEDQMADTRVGQSGELATASYPDRRVEFTVERINPVAEVVNQKNVFKVRVKLDSRPDWMRPGMEGVAKISIDKKSYAWLWSRRLVNWLRMTFWLDI